MSLWVHVEYQAKSRQYFINSTHLNRTCDNVNKSQLNSRNERGESRGEGGHITQAKFLFLIDISSPNTVSAEEGRLVPVCWGKGGATFVGYLSPTAAKPLSH